MSGINLSSTWEALNRFRKLRRVRNMATLGLVVLGPALALMTFGALSFFEQGTTSNGLRFVLLADFVYVLVVAALVLQRVARMIAARRAKSAGSRLHLRLTGVFTIIALIPTVLVAVFATATLNFGLEGWFSDRVSNVVGNSLAAAQAYEREKSTALKRDADVLAQFLDRNKRRNPLLSEGALRELLTQGQKENQRGLREAYVINRKAELVARGDRSYLFDFERPSDAQINQAADGKTVLIRDWKNNEFRALVKLKDFADRYVYVSRKVDGAILSLLDETKDSIALYQQLERDRGRLLFEFALIYLGFAVIVILAAIWLGLWFAERLSRPVGRLAGAAQRVGAGDFNVRVQEDEGDDEIAMLSRVFNQMTKQLKAQRNSLIETNAETERRRRLFDSVLTGVTTGVIGLNSKGEIAMMNAAAIRLLGLDRRADIGRSLPELVPEFSNLYNEADTSRGQVAQQEIQLSRAGGGENLLVRIATRQNEKQDVEGFVITFDDVTDLISAQRMAAWGDVARRIAHEIKNPLTPIQLSAERLKRKFSKVPGVDVAALEQYTDVIVRQTSDLRRIVDEFSKFARMPEPERRLNDLVRLVRDAVMLQGNALGQIKMSLSCDYDAIWGLFDATMISQALINIIKNAGEAIETKEKTAPDDCQPEIRIRIVQLKDTTEICIADNGIGLPQNRAHLFEPYVTNREKGTGLGLSIVKKIIEEHGGTLELLDAEIFEGNKRFGAKVRIVLPMTTLVKPAQGNRNVA